MHFQDDEGQDIVPVESITCSDMWEVPADCAAGKECFSQQMAETVWEQVLTPCCMLRSAAASFTCSWRAAFSKPGGRVACTARSDTGRTSSWACASPLPTALHGSVCTGKQASQCRELRALHPRHAWHAAFSSPGAHTERHSVSDEAKIVS